MISTDFRQRLEKFKKGPRFDFYPDSSGILFFPIFIKRKDGTDGGNMDLKMPGDSLLKKKKNGKKLFF